MALGAAGGGGWGADLLRMSAATMDRMMREIRIKRRKGRSATAMSRRLAGQIPIPTRFEDVKGPGWLEADTVAHRGESLAGALAWSVTFTDIHTGWTENRAIWNRSSRELVKRLEEIESRPPFDIEGFDRDNGTEFLNHRLCRHFRERPAPVEFTRGRPYRKNDNAHLEQKQWTRVRQLLGLDRFEDRRLTPLINDLHAQEWRALQNFPLPSMQLIAKSRDDGHPRRFHGLPRTPYQRLMESPKVAEETKDCLRKKRRGLDPFEPQERIEVKPRAISRIARRKTQRPGHPSVRQLFLLRQRVLHHTALRQKRFSRKDAKNAKKPEGRPLTQGCHLRPPKLWRV